MPMFVNPQIFTIEAVFVVIAIFFCWFIYFKTKEIFDLTKHKGINHFRNTFLFFGLAYVFRFLLIFMHLSNTAIGMHVSRKFIMPFFLVITGYLSTMAIISLFLSISWKRVAKIFSNNVHFIALAISVLAFLSKYPFILIAAQAVLLVIAGIISFQSHEKTKKFSKLFAIYILLFLFWIINLSSVNAMKFRVFKFSIWGQIISLAILAIIYYKVARFIK